MLEWSEGRRDGHIGLTKSPAGVPWNYGTARLQQEETRIYTDRLANAWASDPRRVGLLERAGVPLDMIHTAFKMAAFTLWGYAGDQLQVAAHRSEWSVRQAAALNQKAFKAASATPLDEWERFMLEDVVPTLREGIQDPADEEEEDAAIEAETDAKIAEIGREAAQGKQQKMAELADTNVTSEQYDQLGWEYLDLYPDARDMGPKFVAWVRERVARGPVDDDGGAAQRRVKQRWAEQDQRWKEEH